MNETMRAEDVYKKIVDREISWAHYVWKSGQAEWMRICDTPEYSSVVPAQPSLKPQVIQATKRSQVAAPARGDSPDVVSDKVWFTYSNSVQSGPFSESEINASLGSGALAIKTHVWRDGMGKWEKASELTEFKSVAALRGGAPEINGVSEKVENRAGPRRPIIARILLANDEELAVGVCRDISIGGMQVLTDKIPGKVGSAIKMNVSPAGLSSGEKIEPFVAVGKIVRFLEDGRGFSFRFEKVSPEAQKIIEEFIGE